MEKKKLEFIYEMISTKAIELIENEPHYFYGCKTIEDVLMELGCDVWGDVLYKVGYSPRFYVTEVVNRSPRFCRLFDKVVANFDEPTTEKIMKLLNAYKLEYEKRK